MKYTIQKRYCNNNNNYIIIITMLEYRNNKYEFEYCTGQNCTAVCLLRVLRLFWFSYC